MVALAIEPSQWSAMLSSSGSSSPARGKKVTGKLSPLEPVVHMWDVRSVWKKQKEGKLREHRKGVVAGGTARLWDTYSTDSREPPTIINHRCHVIIRRVRTSTGNECRIGQM